MNNIGVKLVISAEDLALVNPATAQAMNMAICRVLEEIEQAKLHQASSQVSLENASLLQVAQRLHQLVG